MISCNTGSLVYINPKLKNKIIPDEGSELVYELYLVGDAGESPTESSEVFSPMVKEMSANGKCGVVVLGDNIYPVGLRKKDHPERKQDEERIIAQLDLLKDVEADLFFIPGNHDWQRQGEKGEKQVKRQERFIEKYLQKGDVFLPSKGCPGPEVRELSPGLVMIILDTQWWLHPHKKPNGEADDCSVRNTDELLFSFKEQLKKHRNKKIIVAGHHPLVSNGKHGGNFPLKYHLFPLTELSKNAYVPLPVLGSIYPGYRKFLGHRQDIAHPVYRDFVRKISQAMNEYDDIIYVSGHEHNLQYTKKDNFHHIISGAGSKGTYLKRNRKIDFGTSNKGYSKLKIFANGAVWVSFYALNEQGKMVEVFNRKLFTKEIKNLGALKGNAVKISYANQVMRVTPDSTYQGGKMKRFLMGDMYRDLWATEIEVPVLDIHNKAGGLTPIKKGGGMQTISLRLQGANGLQYSLRGIKKNTEFLTQRNLRGTIAQDIIYEGMAGAHPYAALAVPPLANAAKIYYSNPELVYVPKDAILGDYIDEFGGMLAIIEERPDNNMEAFSNFGNSKKVISYSKAIKKIQNSTKHQIDLPFTLRSRIFDMLIGDWDRHDDQWRWATFKKGKKTIYRPIPRDRDQVFFRFDGVLPFLTRQRALMPKFQPFKKEIISIEGFNFNARYFDRAFLSQATLNDWLLQVENLQSFITDSVIEVSISKLPKASQEMHGNELKDILKARRNNLAHFVKEYYEILSKQVDIIGTFGSEKFVVKRMNDREVEVSVFNIKKDKSIATKAFYKRIFNTEETKEIRLYGLDGKDEYIVEGSVNKSILVRIIGGTKKDKIEDNSTVKGWRNYTKIYETSSKNAFSLGKESKLFIKNEPEHIDYNRRGFRYNRLAPLLSLGRNPDDGFYLGAGFVYTKHGFKKEPFEQRHKFVLGKSINRQDGWRADYTFTYTDIIGQADFESDLSLRLPQFFDFHGIGNETPFIDKDEHSEAWVRLSKIRWKPSLIIPISNYASALEIFSSLNHFRHQEGIHDSFSHHWKSRQTNLGLGVGFSYENMDHVTNPHRGFVFNTSGQWSQDISGNDYSFFELKSELRLFIPLNFRKKQTTLAFRSGFAKNFGDFSFFQSHFLGGQTNFRGVYRNRFSGRSMQFNSLELRTSLLKVPNYVVPFDFGFTAYTDLARTWQDKEESKKWHHSYGLGMYFGILDQLIIRGGYTFYENEELLTVSTGFMF
jgi:hypothetical protein